MSERKIRLRIITPNELKVDIQADMVIMRCTTGDMGILPGHIACSVLLDFGVVRIFDDGQEYRIAVYGGVAEINENVLSIITTEAEWPEDIDRSRAESEREYLEQRLKEDLEDFEMHRDQVLLWRSLLQIEVSSEPTMGKRDWKEAD
jgi:F-type H+-transporting ATPase subunit epsilon